MGSERPGGCKQKMGREGGWGRGGGHFSRDFTAGEYNAGTPTAGFDLRTVRAVFARPVGPDRLALPMRWPATLTLILGWSAGLMRISTSLPSALANPISFSREKSPKRPRLSWDTPGCPIPKRLPALSWVKRRTETIRLISRATSALARASSGFGSPMSAKTLSLPSSTLVLRRTCVFILLPLFVMLFGIAKARSNEILCWHRHQRLLAVG